MEKKPFKFSEDLTRVIYYCGMDVHKHEITACIYARDRTNRDFIKTSIFQTDQDGLRQLFGFVKKYRPVAFAMESTGIYHHAVVQFLERKRLDSSWSYDIVVSNPADAAGIPGTAKHDKIDAIKLAKYVANGLLKNGKKIIFILEDLKAIFRMAIKLEKDRTMLKNRIRKTLDRAGIRPRGLNLNHEWTKYFLYGFIQQSKTLGQFTQDFMQNPNVLLKHRNSLVKNEAKFESFYELSLTSVQRALIRQHLIDLDFKTSRKTILALEVDKLLLDCPGLRQQAHQLSTIPGISSFSAVWILAEIGSISYFPSWRHFRSYCGCCPNVVSSAGKIYHAHTNRHSNKFLRTLFYNAAVVVCNFLKHESDLKAYTNRILARKGDRSKKLAYCIIAGKIAKITYASLRDKTSFAPEAPYPSICLKSDSMF
ncbi:IS110 family transposase [Promethearchaeum syntrophicum]|uniref:IS110 family transposase n=1 Tax=Promethearchaeum syntrophicum TaxID=2594042 RepID=A0A5B9DCW0_9ARCH|nr:IS110 family transposase [Candidatus Prometheoarchaeum syntrophicum]